jgi:hypothetical protein
MPELKRIREEVPTAEVPRDGKSVKAARRLVKGRETEILDSGAAVLRAYGLVF